MRVDQAGEDGHVPQVEIRRSGWPGVDAYDPVAGNGDEPSLQWWAFDGEKPACPQGPGRLPRLGHEGGPSAPEKNFTKPEKSSWPPGANRLYFSHYSAGAG